MWKNLKRQAAWKDKLLQLSFRENLVLFLKSVLVMILLNYCFYQSLIAFFPLSFIGVLFFMMERKEQLHKKKEELRWQFKEMLLLTVNGQKAGYSVENAFLGGHGDLVNLYGENSSICKMLAELKAGLENQLSAAKLWKKMSENCDISEIKEFAEVFAIAKESGGNMVSIMERTSQSIESRVETQKEIETLLSARKLELKIMNMMPFLLMAYISATSPSYFAGFYHTLEGTALMTFCLFLYLAAYIIGLKIAAIEV